jgi:hypothetical protein
LGGRRYDEVVVAALFHPRLTLRLLNHAALGLALGATAAVVLGLLQPSLMSCALPTTVLGALVSIVVRSQKPAEDERVRSFYWAALFAAADAAVSGAIELQGEAEPFGGHGPALRITFLDGAFLGVVYGFPIWISMLGAALVVFGFPILWARHLEKSGLAGEERGETIVGSVCAIVSVMTLASCVAAHPLENREVLVPMVLAAGGLLAGGAAALAAVVRDTERRRFLDRAASGDAPGYLVETRRGSKVLLRVAPSSTAYRGTDVEEVVFEVPASTGSQFSKGGCAGRLAT